VRAPSRSEDWQELWNTLDEDGGGTLDKAEVGVLLKLIGRGDLDVDEMMAELDTVR
jgi:Ca2+-binding EF-hand superfamily protein